MFQEFLQLSVFNLIRNHVRRTPPPDDTRTWAAGFQVRAGSLASAHYHRLKDLILIDLGLQIEGLRSIKNKTEPHNGDILNTHYAKKYRSYAALESNYSFY